MIVILTQCFPPDKGGIENLMGALADALAASGEAVTVLADRVRGDDESPVFGYSVRRFGGPRPWRRWQKMCAMKKILAATPLKAVIADSWKSVARLPPLSVPVLVLAHGMEYPANASAAKRERIRAALSKASAVIANSHYTAERVLPYVATPENVTIIHPPIAPQPEPCAAALAQMDAIVEGRTLVIASVSRLEPRKGIDQVIRAMPAILKARPSTVYLVGGAGTDQPRLEDLARRLGVTQAVQFLGKVDDAAKAALLSCADVFAMPTRREGNSVEGFGIAYIEAAWYGVPALAGADGGAVDAVLNDVTGLTCAGDDAAAVQQTLLRLLDDASLRQRLGAAAKERARGELQWSVALACYKALM